MAYKGLRDDGHADVFEVIGAFKGLPMRIV
jgi:hypothetical protein